MTNFFSKEYLSYWDNAVNQSVDGLPIAGEAIQALYLQKSLQNRPFRVLDAGCGSGRNFPVLSQISAAVYGIDVTYEYLQSAGKHPYVALIKAGLEDTRFPPDYFDFLFIWAVFDLVGQTAALYEANRVLTKSGRILLTAKNTDYPVDDAAALVAERNAKMKKFPHRFTDANKLCLTLDAFGFKLVELFPFSRRGDLGQNRCDMQSKRFYEFILVAEKVSDAKRTEDKAISQEFSNTAIQLSKQHGFACPRAFFESSYFGKER